jgi:hypothetical protein
VTLSGAADASMTSSSATLVELMVAPKDGSSISP